MSTLDPCDEVDGQRSYLVTTATTLDVGDGGVRLASDGSLSMGQRVVVEMDLHEGISVERRGLVAWSIDDEHGGSLMGVCFDETVAGLSSIAAHVS